jgi:NADP-dependent 3-hydroxy acid dehydrogenase YdfG
MSPPSTFSPATTAKVDFTAQLNLSELKGKNALITGGASGMGAGFATALAEAGCYVTVVDLNEEMGEASCKGLSEKGLQ